MAQVYEAGGRLFLLNVALGLGTFMQVLDSSIANVALPYIAGNLDVSAEQGTWVVTSFAASNAIVLPLTGWLSDYFGRVRLFVWSVLMFSFVSFLCGLASSLTMLVFLRVLQGAVAGSLIPLSQALMINSNPHDKRGAAMGFWAMIVIVAPVLGPIIGGYLTEEYSWPWIFYINVPIGIFSALLVWYFLRDSESEIQRHPIDWTGLCLLVIGVGSLQIMLDRGKDLDWFESNEIIAYTVVSFIALTYFGIWNVSQKHPIVDFSFFKIRNFALGSICITLGYLLYFGSAVTLPLWLQTQQGYTAYWAGLAVAPIGLVPFIFSTTVGRFVYRYDARFFAASSFLFFALGFFYQSGFTSQVSLNDIMWVRFLQGFGIAVFFLPLVQISLGQVHKDRYASASGLFNFIRILVGSGFGTSLSIQLWTRLEIFHHSRLVEDETVYRPATQLFYRALDNFDPAVINQLLDKQVEQQAYMLATNDLCYMGGWLFLCMIPLVFLCERVKAPQGPMLVAE